MKNGKRGSAICLIMVCLLMGSVIKAAERAAEPGIYEYEQNGDEITISGLRPGEDRNVTEVLIPETIGDIPVTGIAEKAFCFSAIQEVMIPDSVTSVGEEAFSDNDTLRKVVLSKEMTEIPSGMFDGCDGLQELEIPENIRTIGSNAFQETGLLHMELPETVTELGAGAFYWCSDLQSISIRGSLDEIPHSAFTNCFSLTQVELADGIRGIAKKAFAGCSSLEHMALPENLEQIGEYAFMDCRRLQVIYIPESVHEISSTSFYGCRDTMIITGVSGSYAETYAKENGVTFCESGQEAWFNEGILDLGKAGKEDVISRIPAYVRDETVKRVEGLSKFQREELVIPEGVESVGVGETVEKNIVVKRIILPESIKWIDTNAFWCFSALEEIRLPDTTKEIGSYAFQNCESLKEVELPTALDILSSNCFIYSGLVHVTVPGNIKKCLDSFRTCEDLKNVTMEEGVEDLWGTFSSCDNLENVVIPSSMKRISCSTFRECSSLKDVWIYSKDVDLNYRIDYETFGSVEFYGFGDSAEADETYYLFADSPNVVIHGYAGSTAEAFAKEKGLAFEEIA